MESRISWRSFLKVSAIALGTSALCDFAAIGDAAQAEDSRALATKKLKEEE